MAATRGRGLGAFGAAAEGADLEAGDDHQEEGGDDGGGGNARVG